jgi:putative transposase
MSRPRRLSPGGIAYHAMNRSVAGVTLFEDDADYAAFLRVLAQARERFGMRICAFCLMPNHFHLVLWPDKDDLLSPFMQWLTLTHAQRWHLHRGSVGRGHVYQSRLKSFAVEQDQHFLIICRYVERNALRAQMVERAEEWPWGSLACRMNGVVVADSLKLPKVQELLDAWPVDEAAHWPEMVNEPQTQSELDAIRRSVRRGSPFGGAAWTDGVARELGVTLRPRGRPRKSPVSTSPYDSGR